jgi:hypothetical protein
MNVRHLVASATAIDGRRHVNRTVSTTQELVLMNKLLNLKM